MNKCSFRLLLEFRLEINKILLNESIYLREDLEVKSRISSKIVFLAKIALGNYLSIFLKIYMVMLTLNVYLWFIC